MNKNKILIFCILLVIPLIVAAQNNFKTEINENEYIKKFTTDFSIGPIFSYKNLAIEIDNKDRSGNKIIYKPNMTLSLGIEGSYKDFRASFSYKLPNNNTYKYGKTKSFSLNLKTLARNYRINFYFQNYKGFYLSNPKKFDNTWTSKNPYPQRKDIKYYEFGFYTYYSFSDKFSLKAAFQESEKQLKSAGSIMIMISEKFNTLKNDSSLVPFSEKSGYNEIRNLSESSFNTINLQPGYGYTYVWKDYYATSVLFVGGGFQLQSYYENGIGRQIGFKFIPKINFQNAIGYNGDKIFARFVYIIDAICFPQKKTSIINNYTYFDFGVGLRFNK